MAVDGVPRSGRHRGPSASVMDLAETAVFAARLEERITALHELVDEREKQTQQQLAAIRATGEKSEKGQGELNVKANEFRSALDDAAKLAANTQATKAELAALKDLVLTHATQNELDRVLQRVVVLESRADLGAGRVGGVSSTQDFIFRTLPILIAIGALLLSVWVGTHG